ALRLDRWCDVERLVAPSAASAVVAGTTLLRAHLAIARRRADRGDRPAARCALQDATERGFSQTTERVFSQTTERVFSRVADPVFSHAVALVRARVDLDDGLEGRARRRLLALPGALHLPGWLRALPGPRLADEPEPEARTCAREAMI